jgi:nitric oxide reductase NorQ protein
VWRLLLRNIGLGKATLIAGPTGSAKTKLAHEAAHYLGRAIDVFYFGGVFDPETAFIGTTILRGGETMFVRSRFADALETPGRIILLDEVNRAPGPVTNFLLSLLDFQRAAALDIDDRGERIVRLAPGNAVIGTANIGAEYVQTESLDPALVNRMLIIRTQFPEGERELVLRRGVRERDADRIMNVTYAIRQECEKGTIGATVTTRGVEDIAEMVIDGFTIEDATEAVVAVFDEAAVAALRTVVRAAL